MPDEAIDYVGFAVSKLSIRWRELVTTRLAVSKNYCLSNA